MMRSPRFASLGIALLVLCATSAHAAETAPETLNFNFDQLEQSTQALAFSQFDDQGGLYALTGVEITWIATLSGSAFAENGQGGGPDRTVTYEVDVALALDSPGAVVTPLMTHNDSGQRDLSPREEWNISYSSDEESDTITLSDDLVAYLGTGQVDVELSGSGGFSFTTEGGSSANAEDVTNEGSAALVYHYEELTAIPSPATLPAALGMMGLLAMRRPNRRTA